MGKYHLWSSSPWVSKKWRSLVIWTISGKWNFTFAKADNFLGQAGQDLKYQALWKMIDIDSSISKLYNKDYYKLFWSLFSIHVQYGNNVSIIYNQKWQNSGLIKIIAFFLHFHWLFDILSHIWKHPQARWETEAQRTLPMQIFFMIYKKNNQT